MDDYTRYQSFYQKHSYKGFKKSFGSYTTYNTTKELAAGRLTEQDIRREYQRLYNVAYKRRAAFEKAGETKSGVYKDLKAHLTPSSQISSDDLPNALHDLHRWLKSPAGTVSGHREYREMKLEELHNASWVTDPVTGERRNEGLYDFVTRENFDTFIDFLEYSRETGLMSAYGSEQVVDLFATVVNGGYNPKSVARNMAYWIQHQEALEATSSAEKFKSTPKGRRYSLDEIAHREGDPEGLYKTRAGGSQRNSFITSKKSRSPKKSPRKKR